MHLNEKITVLRLCPTIIILLFNFFCPNFFIVLNSSKEKIKYFLRFIVLIVTLTIVVVSCFDS